MQPSIPPIVTTTRLRVGRERGRTIASAARGARVRREGGGASERGVLQRVRQARPETADEPAWAEMGEAAVLRPARPCLSSRLAGLDIRCEAATSRQAVVRRRAGGRQDAYRRERIGWRPLVARTHPSGWPHAGRRRLAPTDRPPHQAIPPLPIDPTGARPDLVLLFSCSCMSVTCPRTEILRRVERAGWLAWLLRAESRFVARSHPQPVSEQFSSGPRVAVALPAWLPYRPLLLSPNPALTCPFPPF
jgi:hypothetical protein